MRAPSETRLDEIGRIIGKLHAKWLQYPEMRLCQLVSNVAAVDDVFYVSDMEIERNIDGYHIPVFEGGRDE